MLAIVIKDLEIYLSNLNLLFRKSIIWLKILAPKGEINKQIASIFYFKD